MDQELGPGLEGVVEKIKEGCAHGEMHPRLRDTYWNRVSMFCFATRVPSRIVPALNAVRIRRGLPFCPARPPD